MAICTERKWMDTTMRNTVNQWTPKNSNNTTNNNNNTAKLPTPAATTPPPVVKLSSPKASKS